MPAERALVGFTEKAGEFRINAGELPPVILDRFSLAAPADAGVNDPLQVVTLAL
jgi:hypothetical protein